jgi:hypothetical protein
MRLPRGRAVEKPAQFCAAFSVLGSARKRTDTGAGASGSGAVTQGCRSRTVALFGSYVMEMSLNSKKGKRKHALFEKSAAKTFAPCGHGS